MFPTFGHDLLHKRRKDLSGRTLPWTIQVDIYIQIHILRRKWMFWKDTAKTSYFHSRCLCRISEIWYLFGCFLCATALFLNHIIELCKTETKFYCIWMIKHECTLSSSVVLIKFLLQHWPQANVTLTDVRRNQDGEIFHGKFILLWWIRTQK